VRGGEEKMNHEMLPLNATGPSMEVRVCQLLAARRGGGGGTWRYFL
jgi:hypothetical protein